MVFFYLINLIKILDKFNFSYVIVYDVYFNRLFLIIFYNIDHEFVFIFIQ
jgi:hypothetical protein